jgi:hypothetical protein
VRVVGPGFVLLSLLFPVGVVAVVVTTVLLVLRHDDRVTSPSRRWSTPYYYAAALIGLVMVLAGVVGGLSGLVQAALPQTSEEVLYLEPFAYGPEGEPEELSAEEEERRRQQALDDARAIGVAEALRGAILAAVGAPVLVWHLRQARRREADGVASPTSPQS